MTIYLEQAGQIHFRGSWRDLQNFLASLSMWERSIGITWSKFTPNERPFHPSVVGDYFIYVHSVGGGKPNASIVNSFIQSYYGYRRPYSGYKQKSQEAVPRRTHARRQVKSKRAYRSYSNGNREQERQTLRKKQAQQARPRESNAGCFGLLIHLILGSQK